MVMDGSASEGLIVHEVAHNYVHGILANNEWREGWLDEGFASFLGNWYQEQQGANLQQLWGNTMEAVRERERAGATEPIGLPSADFRDFGTYNAMTYTKPSAVLRSLRWLIGEDAFHAGMRTYFEDNELRHVREADFVAAMEAAAGEELDWFFEQYIHTTNTLDYALGEVAATQRADGRWDTRIEVRRTGDAWMPVDVRAGDVTQRIDGRDATQTVTITTQAKPAEVVLDPEQVLIEVDVANNRKAVT
jgi:aminopeptidase N